MDEAAASTVADLILGTNTRLESPAAQASAADSAAETPWDSRDTTGQAEDRGKEKRRSDGLSGLGRDV